MTPRSATPTIAVGTPTPGTRPVDDGTALAEHEPRADVSFVQEGDDGAGSPARGLLVVSEREVDITRGGEPVRHELLDGLGEEIVERLPVDLALVGARDGGYLQQFAKAGQRGFGGRGHAASIRCAARLGG